MRFVYLLIPLVVSACAPASLPPGDAGTPASELDSVGVVVSRAAQAYFDAAPQAVGLSVGVVVGDEIRTYHFGSVEPSGSVSPDDGTIYAAASITKTVTGSLLARATLDGRVELGDDVRDYLDGPYPNLEHGGQPVTLAHLVNHVSGLPPSLPDRPEMSPGYEVYGGDMAAWARAVTPITRAYESEDFLRDLQAVRLDTIPGTRFAYSNAGAQLAGLVLERVYGRPYEVLVDSFVTRPLGMGSAGLASAADGESRLTPGYDEQGRRMPTPPESGAAGGLEMTVVDLARYARWHLDESDPVVRLAHTPPGGRAEDPDRGYGVGLNWQMLRSAEGVRRVWQDGNVVGYSARVVLYPELDIGVVVLANELDRSIPEQTDRLADMVLESLDTRTFTFQEGL